MLGDAFDKATVFNSSAKPTTQRDGVDKTIVGRKSRSRSGSKFRYFDSSTGIRRPFMEMPHAVEPLVLHIDDDIDLVSALTARLTNENFRVASATDGQSGVEIAVNSGASCIILDYDLPNGRGDQIIDVLKLNEKTKDIPIIVLTAIHKLGVKQEMLTKGAASFMTKPFEFCELKTEVNRLVYGEDEDSCLGDK